MEGAGAARVRKGCRIRLGRSNGRRSGPSAPLVQRLALDLEAGFIIAVVASRNCRRTVTAIGRRRDRGRCRGDSRRSHGHMHRICIRSPGIIQDREAHRISKVR